MDILDLKDHSKLHNLIGSQGQQSTSVLKQYFRDTLVTFFAVEHSSASFHHLKQWGQPANTKAEVWKSCRCMKIRFLIRAIKFKKALLALIADCFGSRWFTCCSTYQLFPCCYQTLHCICIVTGPAITSGFTCMTSFFSQDCTWWTRSTCIWREEFSTFLHFINWLWKETLVMLS